MAEAVTVETCTRKCKYYDIDGVICNEEPWNCTLVVCPHCNKTVPRTPYCLNCKASLEDARRPYE